MSKILVAGGKGFVGQYIVELLESKGYKVVVYDLPENDITNKTTLNKITKNYFDIVIHVAGIAHLQQCKKDPTKAIKTNVYGTALLLDMCVAKNIKRFIYISSSYVFSSEGGIYKFCKKSCEDLIREYRKLYGLDYSIIRCGSIYGVGADVNNGIYNLINKIRNNEIDSTTYLKDFSCGIDENGIKTREYIHVEDVAKGVLKILGSKYKNKELLLSGTQEISELSTYHKIIEIYGKNTTTDNHYNNTPYSYQSIENEKLSLDTYKDFGAGLLEMVEAIENKNSRT